MIIQISKGYATIVDEQDADLACLKWYASAVKWGPYACRDLLMVKGVRGKNQLMHRLIGERMGFDVSDKSKQIDHINGNPLDNRRSNLRFVSASDNSRNQKDRSSNTSGFKGVHFDKTRNKWMAFLGTKPFKNLGRFDTYEEAVAARLAAEDDWEVKPRRA